VVEPLLNRTRGEIQITMAEAFDVRPGLVLRPDRRIRDVVQTMLQVLATVMADPPDGGPDQLAGFQGRGGPCSPR
jgi:hypothetical protein